MLSFKWEFRTVGGGINCWLKNSIIWSGSKNSQNFFKIAFKWLVRSYEPGAMRLSNHATAERFFGFCLQLPQQVDCLANDYFFMKSQKSPRAPRCRPWCNLNAQQFIQNVRCWIIDIVQTWV